jgi:translation elongation factor EF-1beta
MEAQVVVIMEEEVEVAQGVHLQEVMAQLLQIIQIAQSLVGEGHRALGFYCQVQDREEAEEVGIVVQEVIQDVTMVQVEEGLLQIAIPLAVVALDFKEL